MQLQCSASCRQAKILLGLFLITVTLAVFECVIVISATFPPDTLHNFSWICSNFSHFLGAKTAAQMSHIDLNIN